MKLIKYLFLMLPFFLVACGDDEPENPVFEIFVKTANPGTEITIDNTNCGVSITGEEQDIQIALVGDYDSFEVAEDVPNWISVNKDDLITLHISEYKGDENDMRSATIDFTVFKGNKTTEGHILVHQYAICPEKQY